MKKLLAIIFAAVAFAGGASAQVVTAPPGVQGPASATSGHIATFNGTTGKIIQDGGAAGTGTVTSVTCNGTAITASGTCSTVGQVPGTTTNDGAAAGNVGEYVSNTNTGVAYTGGGGGQNTNSISLTAGDWDITGNCIVGVGSSAFSTFGCTISTVSGTVNTPLGSYIILPGLSATSSNEAATVGPVRVSLSGTTTYYMNMFLTSVSGSPTVGGVMRARRVR
jgi:hypothetical protein